MISIGHFYNVPPEIYRNLQPINNTFTEVFYFSNQEYSYLAQLKNLSEDRFYYLFLMSWDRLLYGNLV